MNYSAIKYFDIANGEGVRTSLFVSGCTHKCPGCFNPETWDFAAGESFTRRIEQQIIDSLAPDYISGITLLGGEPMEPDNQRALVRLVGRVHEECSGKSVWCFTGDRLEELLREGSARRTEVTDRLLAGIDVLVDGPFVEALHDITLRFRGSSNQRIIDMRATRKNMADGMNPASAICLWEDDPNYTTHSM